MAAISALAAGAPLRFGDWLSIADGLHLDPYTIWSLQTGFRQFIVDGKTPRVMDFLAELDSPWDPDGSPWRMAQQGWRSQVPDIYDLPMPGSALTSRHITVRLETDGDDLQDIATAMLELMLARGVRRVQIGFPRPDQPNDANQSAGAPRGRRERNSASSAAPPGLVIGVLEDGCPFGHPSLTTTTRETDGSSETRVVALWDQSSGSDTRADPSPIGLGYGRQRSQSDLNVLLSEHRMVGGGVDEDTLYLDPGALQPRPPLRGSHAAAVTTLLAGRLSLLPSHPTAVAPVDVDSEPPRASRAPDDHASAAPVVVVQFPREQINVVGARWLVVRALDGLRYIGETAHDLSPQALPSLVVNLSYGSMVGAHDGTGLFETAMAELSEAHGRMAIVLAAGNSYGTRRALDSVDERSRTASGRHAVHEALGPGEHSLFRLHIPPNKPIETYLEIWFEDLDADPTNDDDNGQFLGPNDIEVLVTSPIGKTLRTRGSHRIDFDTDQPKKTGAGLICLPRVAQSTRRSMALLVVSATQMSPRDVEVPSGVWSLQVTNTSAARRFRLEAWVERDLVSGAARRSQAARLLAGTEAHAARLTDSNTFNNIATGAEVFRVGALTAGQQAGAPTVSPYSAAGRTADLGPEFSAVADESPARAGIRVSGNGSGAVLRMNGTSLAAPQAARWLANRLADGTSMAEIRRQIADGPADSRRGRLLI